MRFSNIIFNDTQNTDGVALCFYTQGCPHHCKGCFSKQTWDFNGGLEFTNNELDMIQYVLDNYPYDYICLIGGEPLCNIELCNKIIELKPQLKIWIYSGYTFEQILEDEEKLELIRKCDVLVDGKFELDLFDPKLKFRGSSNQRVIQVRESLDARKIILKEC